MNQFGWADRLMQTVPSRVLLGRLQAAAGHCEQALHTLTRAEVDLATLGVEQERDLAAQELRALGMRPPRRSHLVRPRLDAAQQLFPGILGCGDCWTTVTAFRTY